MRRALLIALALAGCARPTNVVLVPSGGSKADGTVTLSYEHYGIEKPVINVAQATASARERCRAWGYADAQPFGAETRQCQSPTEYGCSRWFVSTTWQCFGGKS